MSSAETLQRAIQAARAGRREEARDLLIGLVETEPRNEVAWIWLSGLVDSLEDRIIACENALTLNPGNDRVRGYLAELRRQQASEQAKANREEVISLFKEAKARAQSQDINGALHFARQTVEKQDRYEAAWLLIGRLSPDIDEQIRALEKATQLNPSNAETAAALKQAQYLRANPLTAVARLEQQGKFDEALSFYNALAAKAKNSQEFDHIYKQILRIEALQKEKIRHVAPRTSITRLTFSWPVLYLSLALIQMGLNAFAHPAFYVWFGLPFVALGSYLLSLAEVRSSHVVWQKLFEEYGDGSSFARLITGAAGWFLILIPHIMMLLDSLNRLRNFKIPPPPF